MKVEMAVLADAANVSDSGKMNVLGVFNRISVAELPAELPDMVLAIRLALEFEDSNKENILSVVVADEDGIKQSAVEISTIVGEIEAGEATMLNQVIYLHHVEVEEEGRVTFALLWNGSRAAEVELKIERGF